MCCSLHNRRSGAENGPAAGGAVVADSLGYVVPADSLGFAGVGCAVAGVQDQSRGQMSEGHMARQDQG